MDEDSSDDSDFLGGIGSSLDNFDLIDIKDAQSAFLSMYKKEDEFLIFKKVLDKFRTNMDAFKKFVNGLSESSQMKLKNINQTQRIVVDYKTGVSEPRRILKIKRK